LLVMDWRTEALLKGKIQYGRSPRTN